MIDIYCERLGPELWAEPINAVTNLSFLVAAITIWRLASRRDSLTLGVWLLIGLMIAIGLGSGLFHTFATNWTKILDILPILLFQVTFIWIYGRHVIQLSIGNMITAVILFLVAGHFVRDFPHLLNGSLIYAPAVILLLVLGLYHFYYAKNERTLLLWSLGVFSISLFFRTIDLAICAYVPFGTHFLWHLLNGFLVYLVVRSLLVNLTVTQRTRI